MASLLSLKLLRLLPILSSTFNLSFAFNEQLFLTTFVHISYRDRANSLLPPWFTIWLGRGKWVIIIGFPLSTLLALANIFTDRARLSAAGAEKYYWGGLAFTLGHFLYAPTAVRLLDDISAGRPKGNSTASMRTWLKMNATRALTVDIPACVCFVVGCLAALDVV